MSNPNPISCSKCGAQIPEEDISQGLAVKVSDSNICKVCVDAGDGGAPPPTANQRQPLMQQNIYRFTHDEFDELNRYTFLTAGHIALHRRVEREQGAFDPPELNQDDDTRVLPAQAANKTTHKTHPGNRLPVSKNSKLPIIILGSIAVLVIALLVIVAMPSDNISNNNLTGNNDQVESVEKQKTRSDFDSDPLLAWPIAIKELDSDHPIIDELANDILSANIKKLQNAATMLENKDSAAALTLLDNVAFPDHPRFSEIEVRKQILQEKRNQLIAGTSTIKDPEIDKTPIDQSPDPVEPDPVVPDDGPIEFKALLQLSSAINDNNEIGSDTKSSLAMSKGCTNTTIGEYPAINIGKDGHVEVIETIRYPHSFYLNLWFKVDDNGENAYQWIYSHGANNTKGSVNIYLTEGSNSSNRNLRTVIAFNDMNGLRVDDDQFSLFDGQWHNYALLIDKEKGAHVFIDGELAAHSDKITGPLIPDESILIGCKHDKSSQLKGSVALVQIYQGSKEPGIIQEKIRSIMDKVNADTRWEPIDVVHAPRVTPDVPTSSLAHPSHPKAWHKTVVMNGEDEPIKDIAIIDYDNDGDNDLLVSTRTKHLTYMNDGTGAFEEKGPWDLNAPNTSNTSLSVKDLNNDGLIDLIELGDTTPLRISINNGDGTFTKHTYTNTKYNSRHSTSIHIEDMNNDNRPDILFSLSPRITTILYNTGNIEEFNQWPKHDLRVSELSPKVRILGTKAFDLDNDQRLDYLVSTSDKKLVAFYNRGLKRFEEFNYDGLNEELKGFKTFNNKGEQFLFATKGKEGVIVKTAYKSFELTNFPIENPTHNPPATFTDLNGDSISDYITSNKSKKIICVSDGKSHAELTTGYFGYLKVRSQDLNKDGHIDFLLGGTRSKKSYIVSFVRNPEFSPTTTTQNNDETTNTNDTKIAELAPLPTVNLSRFKHNRRYKTEHVNDLIKETPPLYLGIAEANYPYGVLAKAKSKECTLEIDLEERDASNGGLLIAIHPRDERRTSIDVQLEDVNGVKTELTTIPLVGAGWQHIPVDLKNVPDEFDSSKIRTLTMKDSQDVSSIPFFMYRILIYKDFVPKADSYKPIPNPLLDIDQSNFIKRLKNIKFKQGNLEDTVIISTNHLKDKSSYIKDIRDLTVKVAGKVIPASQSYQMEFDLDWIDKQLSKQIIRKHKPSYILFIGVGNNNQSSANSVETITYWQNIVNICLRNRVLPILCLGPNPKDSRKKDGVYDQILGKGIHEHRSFNFVPIINLSEPKFMVDGNFLQNKSMHSINQIVRSFYLVTCRTYEVEEP